MFYYLLLLSLYTYLEADFTLEGFDGAVYVLVLLESAGGGEGLGAVSARPGPCSLVPGSLVFPQRGVGLEPLPAVVAVVLGGQGRLQLNLEA